MKITSRSRLRSPASAIGISVIASSPGPPASQTIGSGFGLADCGRDDRDREADRAPVRAWLRFSGTVSWPQRAVFSAGIGAGVAGQAARTNRGAVATAGASGESADCAADAAMTRAAHSVPVANAGRQRAA